MDKIKTELLYLEELLISLEEGKKQNLFQELIADDFLEIGSSGKVYTKDAVFEALKHEKERNIVITGAVIKCISENIYLLVYQSQEPERIVKRSSIWVKNENKWQILFHQGTVT